MLASTSRWIALAFAGASFCVPLSACRDKAPDEQPVAEVVEEPRAVNPAALPTPEPPRISLEHAGTQIGDVPLIAGAEVDTVSDEFAVQTVEAEFDDVVDFYADQLVDYERVDLRDGTIFTSPDEESDVFVTRTDRSTQQRVTVTNASQGSSGSSAPEVEIAGNSNADPSRPQGYVPSASELGGPLHPATTPGGRPLTMEQRVARTPDRQNQRRGTPVGDIPATWE